MEDDLLEQSPYFERLRREYDKSMQNVKKAKDRINSKSLNAEEIYGKIGQSIEKSPVRRDRLPTLSSRGAGLPKSQVSPSTEQIPLIEVIPVDENRSVEIRTNPMWGDDVEYVATKEDWDFPKDSWRDPNSDYPPPIPKKVKKDIANLSVKNDGYVRFVKSSYPGAKEGAIERLMMEAAKRDMVPYSSNLLEPGKNMVQKFTDEYKNLPKEKYLEKINKFLTTGKTGKIWSTVAPYIGPVGTGITALGIATAPNPAEAAMEEGITSLIPGSGVAMGTLGVSDEQKALDQAYLKKLRQFSERKK